MSLNDFSEKEGVRFVVLFGSHAKGTEHDTSDYDVAVLFRTPEKFAKKYTELLFSLSEHLGLPAERIDLTNLGADNILLRYEITRDGRLLYGERADFVQYQGFAFREFVDAKNLFELERTLIDRRQEHFKYVLKTP